ncbi:MAG: hypothetical protein R2761_16130 [Acidimicrobiales bacterium]
MPPTNGQAMVPVEHLRPVSRARSEAGGVEQSRAVAEVQAAVLVAQQCPRDVELAKERMRRSCDEYALASRAFYRYDRGDGVVNDASIHLARELAACWGNIDYGIAELHRDDEARQSEMKAWAWDQETNTRPSTTFIVPHARDRGGRRVDLTSLRDVYENNANMGGRRVRQMIFAALPVWFIEEAKSRCRATLERGDGRPLEERIEAAVDRFAGLGVSVDRIEQRLNRPRDRWNAVDLAELTITFQSISRGERAVEDEFPPQRITAAEVAAAAPADPPPAVDEAPAGAPAGDPPSDPDPPASTDPDAVTVDQLLAAVLASGRVPAKAKPDAVVAALVAAAAELVGVHVFLPEELVADQAVAEELLAKLTPAAQ